MMKTTKYYNECCLFLDCLNILNQLGYKQGNFLECTGIRKAISKYTFLVPIAALIYRQASR
jgi:hypothetical protein